MRAWVLGITYLLVLPLCGCKSFEGWWNAPVDEPGTVTIEEPPGSSDPVTIETPGGGAVVVAPPPSETKGDAASKIIGGIVGAIFGNPMIGTLVTGGISTAASSLLQKRKA
jgi:hypothetical protein